jgi:pyridoxamine 5'-phosphate oxidase family protein
MATIGKDGAPHVTPVGFSYNAEHGSIDIGGFELDRTKKYRDIQRSHRGAVVSDDNPSVARGASAASRYAAAPRH